MASDSDPNEPKAWFEEYSRRFTQALDDSVHSGRTSAQRWARRAREDEERTAASVTADAITEWEEFAPLLGRWLDLWLEAAQQPFAGQQPTPPSAEPAPQATPEPDADDLLARRAAEYRELFGGAAEKFRAASYRSPDLVEDWLAFSGKATRDLTLGATAFWGRLAGGLPAADGSEPINPPADPTDPG